jgi:hypothetical protein
VEVLMAEIA